MAQPKEDVLKKLDVLRAWALILSGREPSLSIEITRQCPLACPGCYAYSDSHLGDSGPLSGINEFKGEQLVSWIPAQIDAHKPLRLSIVGGEPLVCWREITQLLPELQERRIFTQIVTSAVAPIPPRWERLLHLRMPPEAPKAAKTHSAAGFGR